VWIWDADTEEEGGEFECASVLNGHEQARPLTKRRRLTIQNTLLIGVE